MFKKVQFNMWSAYNPNQWMEEWMVYLIIGVVAVIGVVGLYIFLKMRKKGMGMSNISISLKKKIFFFFRIQFHIFYK